ncbi:cytidylate kinase, partial [mine drainage metagenome]
ALVYLAADNTAVRAELVRRQRQIAAESGTLVTEGRDQGTLVFPDADFKFYLDADIKERARRRLDELARKGLDVDAQSVLADMDARDQRDKNRGVGALKLANDAIVLDTTAMTLPEVVEAMVKIIGNKSHG